MGRALVQNISIFGNYVGSLAPSPINPQCSLKCSRCPPFPLKCRWCPLKCRFPSAPTPSIRVLRAGFRAHLMGFFPPKTGVSLVRLALPIICPPLPPFGNPGSAYAEHDFELFEHKIECLAQTLPAFVPDVHLVMLRNVRHQGEQSLKTNHSVLLSRNFEVLFDIQPQNVVLARCCVIPDVLCCAVL